MKTLNKIQNVVVALALLALGITFILLVGGNKSFVVKCTFTCIGGGFIFLNEVLIIVKEFAFKKQKGA